MYWWYSFMKLVIDDSYLERIKISSEFYDLICDEMAIKIQSRRYLGNKFKLLDFLKVVVDENCLRAKTVADIFSGTGAVASAFTDKTLITNDLLYSNYLCNMAWFSSQSARLGFLERFNRRI